MGWPKGKPRPEGAGRKKGVPNKESIPLLEKANQLNIDPFEVLLHFANGDWQTLGYDSEKQIVSNSQFGIVEKYTIDPSVRSKAAQEACSYLYPKRKAIEHSTEDQMGFKIVVEDYRNK